MDKVPLLYLEEPEAEEDPSTVQVESRPPAGQEQIPFPVYQPPSAEWQQPTYSTSPRGVVGYTSTTVVHTQPQPYVHNLPPCPNDYLGLSIFATLCCCLLLGIPAIFHATKVRPLHQMGDYEGAKQASERAKGFSIAAIVIGIIILVAVIILNVVRLTKQHQDE